MDQRRLISNGSKEAMSKTINRFHDGYRVHEGYCVHKTPFFKKDMVVLSPWNRHGRVKKAFKDKTLNKVIVMVDYYASDIPSSWEIGGRHFTRRYTKNEIITIGHSAEQITIVSGR
jgi:hypothetical protein